MFDWLFEGWLYIYVFLVVLLAISLGLYYRERKKTFLIAVVGVGVVIGVYWLLDRLVETQREEIGRKLREMAQAVKKRDLNQIFSHIASDFKHQAMNKAGFRTYCETVMRHGWADELEIWGDVYPDRAGKVIFYAKPKGSFPGGGMHFRVHGQFVKESDGKWRLKAFELYDPFHENQTPLIIPGLR